MTFKTTLAAAVLALTPAFALAQGCNSEYHDQQAMSCAEGTSYDEKSGTCMPVVTG